MSWTKQGRRSYHHGNLREALVAAALELIGEKGPAGFTFAEAARAAGVSAAAPYRHFRDREALLADVAARGFDQFAAGLEAAWNNGDPNPMQALEAVGRAYLDFARTEPAYYAAMFEAQLPPDLNRELTVAADKAFAVLRRAADAVCAPAATGAPAAWADGQPAHLVDGPRHRLAVRPRRRRPAQAADPARRPAGGRRAGLSGGSRLATGTVSRFFRRTGTTGVLTGALDTAS